MYSPVELGLKYLRYFISAANGRGHGIHSPFVFNFVTRVLNDKTEYEAYSTIEALRKEFKRSKEVIVINDFGAGSSTMKSSKRKVAEIASSSLKPRKFSQLLYRMVRYYKPSNILELGTSLGITTAYLASANPAGHVCTMEGAEAIAGIARQTFENVRLRNIDLVQGNFDATLESQLNHMQSLDFAFIDGNHRKEPTLNYFTQLLAKANDQSIFVFDDIHWSDEMEEAWKSIQQHPSVTLTIDLFFIGLVFFRKEQKIVQHFTIRF